METEQIAVPEIEYTDPYEDWTPRKSQAWYNLRKSFLAFKVDLKVANTVVPLESIERNENDGGKWRWDTPLFDKEVDALIAAIQHSGKFEAVWLKYDTNSSTYSVLDGHHRLVAWKKMGNTTIPAVVVTVSKFVSKIGN
jgi:ParB-like nuclease domain